MNDGSHHVVVIGAGPAGLAVAGELARRGCPAAVLERGEGVAASWRGRYDRLRLNTSRLTSRLPGAPYPKRTPLFPPRDALVRYLEDYADQRRLDVRLGVRVDQVNPQQGGWQVVTPTQRHHARQVLVCTGHEHTPQIPAWPGVDRYAGRLQHSADYRDPAPFRGTSVLVVGPGSSGMEIAFDLAEGGARRVWLAVRTQPNIMLRQLGGLPGDLPARVLVKLPPAVADAQANVIRRLTVGDLSRWGLTPPEEGIFTLDRRCHRAPAIVDRPVIDAIRAGRIEIVPAVQALDETGALLSDQTRLEPSAIIAATGYGTGLQPLVGHLGVLDHTGVPLVHGGPPAAPGLRFLGYRPGPGQIGHIAREARRAARGIIRELTDGPDEPLARLTTNPPVASS